MDVASLLNKSKFFKYLNSLSGSNVSKSLILFPLKLRCVSLGLVNKWFNPLFILKYNQHVLHKRAKYLIIDYLLSLNSNFLKLGNLGNPLRDVKPTLIKLKTSKLQNSSVRPTILVLLQLSKFKSLICNSKNIMLLLALFELTNQHKENFY